MSIKKVLVLEEIAMENEKKKKDAKALNVCIERSIYERFSDYCYEVGQSKTTAIERILTQFLNEYGKKEVQI